VLAVLAGLATWCYLDREPEYDGRSLSYWLDDLLSGSFEHGATETYQALREIGSPAAEALVQSLAATDSPLRRHYRGLRSLLPASLNSVLPRERLAAADARNNAFSGLCQMGSTARWQTSALTELLGHGDKQVRVYAILVLASIGADAKTAEPALVQAGRDPELSSYVREALSQIAKAPPGRTPNNRVETNGHPHMGQEALD